MCPHHRGMYTHLDSTAHCTPGLHGTVYAPGLQAWTVCYCTKHKTKSNTSANGAIRKHNKQEMPEAVAGITGPLLYDTLIFISRKGTLKNKDKQYSAVNT